MPLPAAASGASVFINEKSEVNAAASGAGTDAAGADDPPPDELDPEEPQAAARATPATPRAAKRRLDKGLMIDPLSLVNRV
jgi:hypothetical protein